MHYKLFEKIQINNNFLIFFGNDFWTNSIFKICVNLRNLRLNSLLTTLCVYILNLRLTHMAARPSLISRQIAYVRVMGEPPTLPDLKKTLE